MLPTGSQLCELRDLLGPAGFIGPGDDCLRYETPARYAKGQASCVLRPATTAEVSLAVGYCVRNGLSFVPQSGNTGLTGASTPDASGEQIVLSLERLVDLLDVSPRDRTATVAAGIRLSALNAALEPHGLVLPIDLGADPMIGGMVATNTGGARFLRYGDMRRHVLGLEVVLADAEGTVLDLMTELRKDNARLDLKHLFIGSSGAFGVITRAVLELQQRPGRASTALLVPRDAAAVLETLLLLEQSVGRRLSAFEAISGAALAHAFAHLPRLRNPFSGGALPAMVLLVEISGEPESAADPPLQDVLVEAVGQIADQQYIRDAYFDDGLQFWAIRHALSEGLRAAGRVVGIDLSFARSRVMEFRDTAIRALADRFPEVEICDFGHVADGGLHFNLLARDPGVSPSRLAEARDWAVACAVDQFGGSFSGEHGLGPAVQDDYDRLVPQRVKFYAGRLQTAFGVQPAARVKLAAPQ